MTESTSAPGLEAALLERAERLAAEVTGRARDSAAAIVREQRQRLHAREERVNKEAAAAAERLYRRKVQSAELRLQGETDRLRWALIAGVLEELPKRLGQLVADPAAGERLLMADLARAASELPDGDLRAELGDRDHERYAARWEEIAGRAMPGRRVELVAEPLRCSGGVRVSSADGRTRVDATFEGRIDRLREQLVAEVAECLFARDPGRVG